VSAVATPLQRVGWWCVPGVLERFLADLIADELAQLRPGGCAIPALPWSPGMLLDEEGLGLDSLERMAVASALNEALHLHESGVEDLLLVRRRFWRLGRTGPPRPGPCQPAPDLSHLRQQRNAEALRPRVGLAGA